MVKNNHCPDCQKSLALDAQLCTCGWRLEAEIKTQPSDHRCQFQSQGRRCPLAGSVSVYAYGIKPWYCSDHSQAIDDPIKGESILNYIEKNYAAIINKRKDWRKELWG